MNGLLECACGEQFPIINSVPRLLLGEFQAQLFLLHREYRERFGYFFKPSRPHPSTPATQDKLRTQITFGYEWSKFSRYEADNFLRFVRPLGEGFFANKFGLDVGCGAGRHAQRVTTLGAEIIGFDLSHAIDTAFHRNQDNASAHFVQGDVYNLPFRRNQFDFIYSLGVLHHLPHPEEGFRRLVPHLKPGAPIFIWVYQRTRRKELLEHARTITARLPMGIIRALGWLATLVDYGIIVNLYRALRRFHTVNMRTPLRIKEYAEYDFYASYTDWFDRLAAPISHSYTESEICEWLQRADLTKIETALVDDSWIWAKGHRGR